MSTLRHTIPARSTFSRISSPSIPRGSGGGLRAFHTSQARSVGKESKLHEENRGAEAEEAKQQQLREQKEGKGQWKEGLASDSESIVKADRNELKESKETISELQRESAKAAELDKKRP